MTTAANGAVLQKTLELCETIATQPDFVALRQHMDAFMADDGLKARYEELAEQSASLQHQQQHGQNLDAQEVSAFEAKRDAFLENPTARGFLNAQQSMRDVRETVTRYVTRTFELGRVPTEDDFGGCGCDSGCGCH
jgi:cell fate (sporulation/competence/biofilm development) regulator YlbF (YheA/YmcA/DUF963 family)